MIPVGIDAVTVLLVDEITRAVVDTGIVQRIVAEIAGQSERRKCEIRRRGTRRVIGRRDVDGARGLRAVGQHFIGKQGLQLIGRLPQQLGSAGEHVRAADPLTVTRVGGAADRVAGAVAHPAVLAFFTRHQAQCQLVCDQGHVEGTLGIEFVEAAAAALRFERRLVEDRRLGLDDHRATGRVLAEQSALRATQYLDFLDVERIEQLRLGARHHEVVDQHGHGRFVVDDDVGIADAAHRERRGIEPVDLVRREVRYEYGQILQRARLQRGDRGIVDGGNRDRRRLQVRLPALRRDDDFLETAGPGRRRCRLCMRGRRQRRRHRHRSQKLIPVYGTSRTPQSFRYLHFLTPPSIAMTSFNAGQIRARQAPCMNPPHPGARVFIATVGAEHTRADKRKQA